MIRFWVMMAALMGTGVMSALTTPAWGQAEKKAAPQPVVVKYVGAQKSRLYGQEVMVVAGVGMLDGRQMQIAVPNNDAKSGKFDPRTSIAETVKGLTAGDVVKIQIEGQGNQVWVKEIEPYKLSPGEDQPGAFVFIEGYTRPEGGQEYLFVTLNKLAHEVFTVVPLVKGPDGKSRVPDPAIAEQVGKFQKGDVVEAMVQPGRPMAILQSIEPYALPQTGKFEKMADAEIDGAKYPAASLEADGKAMTLPIAGKMQGKKRIPDPRVLSAAKAIKPGAEVILRTREEGGTTYLKEIRPAPKAPAAPRTLPAKPASGGAGKIPSK